MNHGVYVTEQATSVSTPNVAASGIPFVVGTAPVQSAAKAVKPNMPVLCRSWDEAVQQLGYSEDWKTYTLCEFMHSHFELYGCQPVIFVNVLDIGTMKESVEAADLTVTDHKVRLPIAAINNETLVVKAAGGSGGGLVLDKDYSTYYDGENLVIEAIADGKCYEAGQLNIAYTKAAPASVTEVNIATAMESVELCLTTLGAVPDLICAPGYSHKPTVAAVMATKASSINGLFRAKALIDIDSSSGGAKTYTAVQEKMKTANLTDKDEICCWPMVKLNGSTYHMSTHLAGLMAQVDTKNSCPYETPSNKPMQVDALCLEDGTEVNLTHAQANYLNGIGVVTALNFNGWVAWGNYTACYPGNTDIKDNLIPVSRMFDWVANSLVRTFWSKLDRPMNRRLIDTVLDASNIWLNGLVGAGYLLGARAVMLDGENPLENLMAGIIKLHIYMTPPAPAQEIDFVLEYDASYVSALQG